MILKFYAQLYIGFLYYFVNILRYVQADDVLMVHAYSKLRAVPFKFVEGSGCHISNCGEGVKKQCGGGWFRPKTSRTPPPAHNFKWNNSNYTALSVYCQNVTSYILNLYGESLNS